MFTVLELYRLVNRYQNTIVVITVFIAMVVIFTIVTMVMMMMMVKMDAEIGQIFD